MHRKPTVAMSAAEARSALERLQVQSAQVDPSQAAPVSMIAELHTVLKAITARENVQRYRLDGLHGVNMTYLHRRVGTVLEEFDRLVMEPPRKSRAIRL
jgi:hypothetical protein